MHEQEYERLGEIEREYESMGITSGWILEYNRLSTLYPDPVTDQPFHNGQYLMLPSGTMPCEIYLQKLTSFIEDLEKEEKLAREAHRSYTIDNERYNSELGKINKLYIASRMELYKRQMARPKQIEEELYRHLFKVKPIDVKGFHDKMNALMKEKMKIMTNIRIAEATMMMTMAKNSHATTTQE